MQNSTNSGMGSTLKPPTPEGDDLSTITQEINLLSVMPPQEILFRRARQSEDDYKTVVLRNTSLSNVAFKFKTNDIEAYKVNPPIGILKPSETIEVQVQILADHKCLPKDKLLIVSAEVDKDSVTPEEMSRTWLTIPEDKQFHYKIRCKCEQPPEDAEIKDKSHEEISVMPATKQMQPEGSRPLGSERTPSTSPDLLGRFQGEFERLHRKLNSVTISVDSFGRKVFQLMLLLLIVLLVVVSVPSLYYKVTRRETVESDPEYWICDPYLSDFILPTILCK